MQPGTWVLGGGVEGGCPAFGIHVCVYLQALVNGQKGEQLLLFHLLSSGGKKGLKDIRLCL